MKKILLILSVTLFTVTLYAQTFHILDGSKNNVSDGQFTVNGDVNTIIKAQLYVVNSSGVTAQFRVKKADVSVLPGTSNTFCFNDQCYPPTSNESTSSLTLQAGDTTSPSGYYGEFTPGTITGQAIVRYTVINAADVTDSTHVTVTYNIQPASIFKPEFSRVEFSNPYPNPVTVNTRINYNIPFSYVSATLVIRNIIGTNVKEVEIGAPQGKLNLDLSDLNEGIYFYSLVIDGHIALTRKLIKN